MARPTVMVKQGWLRGMEINSEVGGSFISFRGIPFAEPPVADLRFKDPQPKQPWSGVREAVKEGSQCMQLDELSNEIEGDEDCLYLNVATTSLEGSRPVMFWIHGGGFTWGDGSSDIYGPDYLVNMDIVFVSINYRLGVFGFLQLEHEAATGNMGLKDQVAGLKWVKENIAKFGGDPNNVTIFGESAGAASVHYHLLSPLSKGLFHKAILQSGVALNPWALVSKTTEIAHRLVARLGKETTDPDEIIAYLRTVPAHEICKAQTNISTREELMIFDLPFAASIDNKSMEPFLPRSPRELIAECEDIPIIIGNNSHEGAIFSAGFTDEIYRHLDQNFEIIVASVVDQLSSSELSNTVKEAKKFYFKEKRPTEDDMEGFVQCTGDVFFNVGIHETVGSRTTNKAPTYFYRFSHNAPNKISVHLWKTEIEGAGHFDEIPYLFYPTRLRDVGFVKPDSIEQVISKRFVRMWTDFAKTGNPTPQLDELITVKWEPVSSSSKNYLAIDTELSAGVKPDEEMWQFWKQIYDTTSDKNNQ